MNISANAAAREIEATLGEIRRDVSIFTAEQAELLAKLYQDKDTDSRELLNLTNLLEKRMPNIFTYTISNEDSSSLLDDFNFNIGDICRIDIQNFVLNSFKQNIRIHPHPSGYHFDIMTPFVGFNNEILIFFATFLPYDLNRILNSYANDNFELIVSSTLHQGLIEITREGTRAELKESFYLTESAVHTSFPVPNTYWEVSVITKKGLYSDYIENIIWEAFVLLTLFLTICTPILLQLGRQFRKRQAALVALKESEISFFDLYEYAPDIYMTINRSGLIESANKHAREFFHLDESPLDQKTLFSLLSLKDIERVSNHIDTIFSCNTLESEYEFMRKESLGTPRHIHARFRLTPKIPNVPRNLRIVCRDITNQKQAARLKLKHTQIQRDALVREVHHRIKNNLQNIISLLKTYSRKNPEIEPAIKEISSKIGSISEAYGLQSKSRDNLVNISNLIISIVDNEKKLFLSRINVTVDPVLKNDGYIVEQEVTPIAVIISELVTNAIKHGKVVDATVANISIERVMNGVKIEIGNTIGLTTASSNTLTSGQGHELIESLLPPKGAVLNYKKTSKEMKVTLFLESPEVIVCTKPNKNIIG